MGAFKYLEKPYAFEKLVEVIKQAYEARLKTLDSDVIVLLMYRQQTAFTCRQLFVT